MENADLQTSEHPELWKKTLSSKSQMWSPSMKQLLGPRSSCLLRWSVKNQTEPKQMCGPWASPWPSSQGLTKPVQTITKEEFPSSSCTASNPSLTQCWAERISLFLQFLKTCCKKCWWLTQSIESQCTKYSVTSSLPKIRTSTVKVIKDG